MNDIADEFLRTEADDAADREHTTTYDMENKSCRISRQN